MDYCFMRTDTGYDVMMLAVYDHKGLYQVYRLGNKGPEEPPLFAVEDPATLREKIKEWCRDHLSDDMKMVKITVRNGRNDCLKMKKFLEGKSIPYEMKRFTFFVRKREYEKVKDTLNDIAPFDSLNVVK
ncbi:MAG: hypothetical protein ACO1OC_09720 [Tuberibacillus sp.]